ncbi:MAG: sigma-70 family RNA polymerase sigma factor [Thermoanaerobaculia bacterium]
MDTDTARDIQLLTRCAMGDRDAFAGLFDAHSSVVLGVLVSMVRDRAVAEELMQETFLQAWNEAERYRSRRGTPRGWLIMMARSRAIDLLRSQGARAKREAVVGGEMLGDGSVDPVGTATLEASERKRSILAALQGLPAEQRQCIELAFYGGLSHRQVAERLEQPLGTVKSRILLGMRRLKEALAP